LELVPGTVVGGASYDAVAHQLTWQGNLPAGAERVIHYQAVATTGSQLDNHVTIYYARHQIPFEQTATVWVNAPDLSDSTLTAVSSNPGPHSLITYTLHLQNSGLTTTQGISAMVRLPDAMYPLTDTLQFSAGSGLLADQRIHWQGDLVPGTAVTATMQLTTTTPLEVTWFSATAVVNDGVTHTQIFPYVFALSPYTFHFPFIARK
jgi:hypothetical protein